MRIASVTSPNTPLVTNRDVRTISPAAQVLAAVRTSLEKYEAQRCYVISLAAFFLYPGGARNVLSPPFSPAPANEAGGCGVVQSRFRFDGSNLSVARSF